VFVASWAGGSLKELARQTLLEKGRALQLPSSGVLQGRGDIEAQRHDDLAQFYRPLLRFLGFRRTPLASALVALVSFPLGRLRHRAVPS
jgi:hypothetical protein